MKIFNRFIVAWLLCIVLPTTAGHPFCPGDDWVYYSPTKICMTVVLDSKVFTQASVTCGQFRIGNGRKDRGVLVHILDKETDDFVTDLLADHSVQNAYIGLMYLGSEYKWNDGTSLGGYTRWKTNEPDSGIHKPRVVTTSEGWTAVSAKVKTQSVCQIKAVIVLQPPTLTCPPAEEGMESKPLTCTGSLSEGINAPTLQYHKTGEMNFAAICTTTQCNPDDSYTADQNSTATEITSSLRIQRVTREHETTWQCSFTATDAPEMASSNCSLTVYTPPDDPRCSHTFSKNTVEVTCISDKVYPHAKCSWEYYLDTVRQNGKDEPYPPYTVTTIGGNVFYKTTCKMLLSVGNPGLHKFRVFIYPRVDGMDMYSSAARSAEHTITVSPPTDPPVIYSSNGSPVSSPLVVKENETVTISCDAIGGNPIVVYTMLSCDSKIVNVDGQSTLKMDGQTVTMEIFVTKDMNEHKCTCSAKHISGAYDKTLVVIFSVKHPPEVTSFEITGKFSYTKIIPGRDVSFICEATGNPVPATLQLYRVGDNGLQMSELLTEVTESTTLEYTVTASCNMSDEYACLARNDANIVDSIRFESLKVNCPPEHCDLTNPRPQIKAMLDEDAIINLCVLAYPEPITFQLFTGDGEKMVQGTFDVSFNYTSERTTEGIIILVMKDVTRDDLGEYYLLTGSGFSKSARSYLPFELIPQDLGRLTEDDDDQDSTTLIIPIVIALLVVIIVVGIVILLLVKRRNKKRGIKIDPTLEGKQLVEMNALSDVKDKEIDNDPNNSNYPEKDEVQPQDNHNTNHEDQYGYEAKEETLSNNQNCSNMDTPEATQPMEATNAAGENCCYNTLASDTSTDKEPNQEKISSNDGRTVNDDGLVYVEVEVNKANASSEGSQGDATSKATATTSMKPEEDSGEPVEYTTVNFEDRADGMDEQEKE